MTDDLFDRLKDSPPPLTQIERLYARWAFKLAKGSKSKLARILGIDRRTVYRNIRDWGLDTMGIEVKDEPEVETIDSREVIEGELMPERGPYRTAAPSVPSTIPAPPEEDTAPSAAPEEREYEIKINDIAYAADYHALVVDFEVPNAPVHSYSRVSHPHLRATVGLRRGVEPARRLTAGPGGGGGGSALATLGNTPQKLSLEGLTIELQGGAGQIPGLPTEDEVLEACRKELQRHLDSVEREKARIDATTQTTDSLKGKTFKVRG